MTPKTPPQSPRVEQLELEVASLRGLLSAIVASVPGAEPVNVLAKVRKLVAACEPFKRAFDSERYHKGISLHHWHQLSKAMSTEKESEAAIRVLRGEKP